ncbi:MAG: hypothetical protein K2X94_03065, partial [Amoebophilaceae bacterium]|nr:hypothetical protein [Amoebophilaceae bacterium]
MKNVNVGQLGPPLALQTRLWLRKPLEPVLCCDDEVINGHMLTLKDGSIDDIPSLVDSWMVAIQAIEGKIDRSCWSDHIKAKLSIILAEKLTEATYKCFCHNLFGSSDAFWE